MPSKPKRKIKFYAVHKGRKTGIFMEWTGPDGCEAQIKGFQGAVYKSFSNRENAAYFVEHGKIRPIEKVNKEIRTAKKTEQLEDRYYPIASDAPLDEEKDALVVYVDGSAKKDNKGIIRGGYGVIFGEDDPRNFKEAFMLPNPTNNRCEVRAAKVAIDAVNNLEDIEKDRELIICTDSLYTIEGVVKISEGKLDKVKKNKSLFLSLYKATQTRPVSFLYTPGHSGEMGNEMADKAAQEIDF